MPPQTPARTDQQAKLTDRDLVVMGQVLGPFGVKGWLKIRPSTQAVGALLDYRRWWVEAKAGVDQWRAMVPVEGHEHGVTLLARLEGMTARNEAQELKGARIAVARTELPEAAEDEFYWADLIGMSVVNLQGVALGLVTGLLATGAHDVLQIRGEREYLIPFVEVFVTAVDRQAKVIRVDWQPDY